MLCVSDPVKVLKNTSILTAHMCIEVRVLLIEAHYWISILLNFIKDCSKSVR